ncbi:MAG: sulfur carrier protein ThiS [Planctomycetes bacterium]|nr:sulfur carrier protein ThiS [Planctomycetota bacterium]
MDTSTSAESTNALQEAARIEIVLNGAVQSVAAGTTIAALVRELGLQPKFVAVEQNRELVPRGRHAAAGIAAGDQIEIVTLVGGG